MNEEILRNLRAVAYCLVKISRPCSESISEYEANERQRMREWLIEKKRKSNKSKQRMRLVIKLREEDNLKFKEIAKIIGCSESWASSYYHYASRIRDYLIDEPEVAYI